jgi:hypothetical protein
VGGSVDPRRVITRSTSFYSNTNEGASRYRPAQVSPRTTEGPTPWNRIRKPVDSGNNLIFVKFFGIVKHKTRFDRVGLGPPFLVVPRDPPNPNPSPKLGGGGQTQANSDLFWSPPHLWGRVRVGGLGITKKLGHSPPVLPGES